jgi:polar amino acid transport system substrate-binding protein
MLRVFGLLLALLVSSAMAAEKVRYCDYPVYPPISWSDGKHVRGLAPSVVKNLFGRLGYDVDIVVLGNWKRCLLDAAEGRVDVVLAYSTAQREQSMVFSTVPVLREEVALFINRQHPVKFERLEDLAHYRGGLLFGESYGVDFDRLVAQHQNIEWVSDSGQNFGKLIRGRIDFITSERRTGQLYVENLPGAQNIVALPNALSVDYLRVAVSRKSPLANRMPEIDAQLKRMVDAGEVEQLLNESEVTYRDMINLPANSK